MSSNASFTVGPCDSLSRASALFASPRLMSPIHLQDSLRIPSYKTTSQLPCSSTKRCRSSLITDISRQRSRSPRHRQHRHHSMTACPIRTFRGPAAFDELPWIASLDTPPDAANLWDLADLSQLPIPCGKHVGVSQPSTASNTGPGPVRRRKSSLRATPFTSSAYADRGLDSTPELSPSMSEIISPSSTHFQHLPRLLRTPSPRLPACLPAFISSASLLSGTDWWRSGPDSDLC